MVKKLLLLPSKKFPFIIDGIADLSDKRFAVLIDEAHSSQSGTAHNKMNEAMGGRDDEDVEDTQDKILKAMRSRKMRGNASYLAFTATPKKRDTRKVWSATAGRIIYAFSSVFHETGH